jgi:hypothetical protein
LIAAAENDGEQFLPKFAETIQPRILRRTAGFAPNRSAFRQNFEVVSVVGRMLRDDEPLKPTLLIFARIYEQTQELIAYINNRLLRFPTKKANFLTRSTARLTRLR